MLKKQKGFSLIEVLVALALLGVLAAGFLVALANSSSHSLTANIRATAESLARTQMESIKNEPYQTGASTNPALYTKIALPSSSWDISWTVSRLDPENLGNGSDEGLQKIDVTVKFLRGGAWSNVFTLEGYKYV